MAHQLRMTVGGRVKETRIVRPKPDSPEQFDPFLRVTLMCSNLDTGLSLTESFKLPADTPPPPIGEDAELRVPMKVADTKFGTTFRADGLGQLRTPAARSSSRAEETLKAAA